ncbi:hypothetical protein FIM10_17315 [Sphingomonadales bacterium 56]|uniref:Uncharacterized protein n=1 Tax=Sphingobium agri TaxID=2933566 RepID=A0ABT0DSD9_9SPHN|nr:MULTISPECIES: hypothetical protein [Sphingobium]MBY2930440.1 hypothetical protein [Sphingomonadales bacterium 56]MBY2960546.1 hypothetical protein [Sphingomonadales bacterium 58]MCK0530021.1 hypothetical protein [Sphingobium agri]
MTINRPPKALHSLSPADFRARNGAGFRACDMFPGQLKPTRSKAIGHDQITRATTLNIESMN